ncbi:MAG: ABC transporter ATP-binding protein [Clostridiales bacterium]|nr:ABC transporter ATP-binding protein [Clostridiales bacterium]
MIEVKNLYKSYNGHDVLSNVSLTVKKGSIYGLVGANGAGKTTLIKHLTGVFKQDKGEILINGQSVFENPAAKSTLGYIPDDLFFFSMYTMKNTARFFKKIYNTWNDERYKTLLDAFKLDENRRISKFSKGMQKQAAFIMTMSYMPEILILDEPIDGLDPLVRKRVWKLIIEDVAERGVSVLVSSHNLKELEGICDSIGILNNGHMVIERELDELKSDISKIQIAFCRKNDEKIFDKLHVLHHEERGSINLLIVKGNREYIIESLKESNPLVLDVLPLTLEEIFIYELGGDGCEINGILF